MNATNISVDSASTALEQARDAYKAAVEAYGERPSELARKRAEQARAAVDAADLDLTLAQARQTALDRQAAERERLALQTKLAAESAAASHSRFIAEAKPILETLARNVREAEATIAALDRIHAAQAEAAGRAMLHAKDLLVPSGDRALSDSEVSQLAAVSLHAAGVGARLGDLLMPRALHELRAAMRQRGEHGRALEMAIERQAQEAGFGHLRFSLDPSTVPPAWNDPRRTAWDDAREALGLAE